MPFPTHPHTPAHPLTPTRTGGAERTAVIVAPDVARRLTAHTSSAASPVFVLRDSEDAEGAVARVVRDGRFRAAVLDAGTRGDEPSQVWDPHLCARKHEWNGMELHFFKCDSSSSSRSRAVALPSMGHP